jgi:DNA-binding transcriptional LysR family regulator
MRLSSFDLNLLLAFEALMEERSVSRAAARMAVTQSAMSHTLARLRKAVGDPLFVRTPAGMRPTPRALALVGPVHDALSRLENALLPEERLDPAKIERTFTILTNSALEFLFFPALSVRLASVAPGINLKSIHIRSRNVAEELEDAIADVAIVRHGRFPAALESRVLFRSRQVCMVRHDHPAVGDVLDMAQYASLGHVEVNRWGSGELSGIDRWLAEHGLTRRVVVTTTGILTIPHLLAGSDWVATLGERVAHRLSESYPLRVVEPPFGRVPYPLSLIWNQRDGRDPVHRWFRAMVEEAGRTIGASIEEPAGAPEASEPRRRGRRYAAHS